MRSEPGRFIVGAWSTRRLGPRTSITRKGPGMSSEFVRAKRELRTLSHLVDVLAEHGDRQAVMELQRGGVASWSYRDLIEYARRLAHGLTRAGVSRGEHVMLFGPSRPEWIVACLAIVGAGALATPVDVPLTDEALPRDP